MEYIEPEDTFLEVPLLEVLGLDGSQLSHTIEGKPEHFHSHNHLKQLTLSRNAIKSVGTKALVGHANLEQVNPISNLKLVVFLIVRLLQLDPFSHLALLTRLQLNISSLLCACNLRWFPTWINQTGVQAKFGQPENLKNKNLTFLR